MSIVDDLRELLRKAKGRNSQTSAAILDGRTMQSTRERGERAGYDGAKKKGGSRVHMAEDMLGNLLEILITAANERERAQVEELSRQVQEITSNTVKVAFVDQR